MKDNVEEVPNNQGETTNVPRLGGQALVPEKEEHLQNQEKLIGVVNGCNIYEVIKNNIYKYKVRKPDGVEVEVNNREEAEIIANNFVEFVDDDSGAAGKPKTDDSEKISNLP